MTMNVYRNVLLRMLQCEALEQRLEERLLAISHATEGLQTQYPAKAFKTSKPSAFQNIWKTHERNQRNERNKCISKMAKTAP